MTATKDRVTIELYVDDQGSIRIAEAKAAVADLAQANKGVADSAQSVSDSMAPWADHAQSALVHLAAMVGVTLSIAGAVSVVKAGLQEIADFNLSSIATSAMILSRANIQGIEAQQAAYGNYKAYVLGMYETLEEETLKHFSSGKEMIGTFNALAMRGIYASQEEAGAVGVVADAVKLLHGGLVDQQTVLHEIQGVLEGHAGRFFRLAEILRGQIGPGWKEVIQSHIQDNTLLGFMEDQFKGLVVAAGDIQQQWMAQKTSLDTVLAQIGRGGLAGMYQDLIGLAANLNDYLREHKDSIITGIRTGWEGIKTVVNAVRDTMTQINSLASTTVYPKSTTDKTLEATGSLDATKVVSWDQAQFGLEQFKTDLGALVGDWHLFTVAIPKTFEALVEGFSSANEMMNEFWAGVEKGGQKLANSTQAGITGIKELSKELVTSSNIITDDMNWYLNVKVEKKELNWLDQKLIELTNIISKNYVLNVMVNWINSAFPALPKGVTTATDATSGASSATMSQIEGLQGGDIGANAKTPPWSPAKQATGGAGKSTEGAENRMISILDTLDKELARLSNGSLAEVDGWLKKMLDDIDKVAVKGIDGTAAESKSYELAFAKKQKLTDDFWLKIARESGDTFALLDAEYKKDLKTYQGVIDEKKMKELAGITDPKARYDAELAAQKASNEASLALDQAYGVKRKEMRLKFDKEIEDLSKSSLSALASTAPYLSEQLVWEQKLLDTTIRHNAAELELKITKLQAIKTLNQAEVQAKADEARGLAALEAQYQRFAQERKNWQIQGVAGGVKGFIYETQQKSETSGYEETKAALTSAKSYLGDTLGTAIADGFFKKGKVDFKKMAEDGATSLIKKLTSLGFNKLFDVGAKAAGGAMGMGVDAATKGAGAAAGAASDAALTAAATALTTAGASLTAAGAGLDVSGIDLDTSGISLDASGIGLDASAIALTAAATALEIAAIALAVSAVFHSGGVVMHGGGVVPVYAHQGLNTNEVSIIALRGEGVLPIPTMQKLGSGGFEALRSGNFNLGAKSGGGGGGGGASVVHHTSNITIITPGGQVLGKAQINQVLGELQTRINHREIRLPRNG